MLKKGIKNFFSCLKYFFTPLGTMFLGIMIGVSIFISGAMGAVNALIGNVTQLAQNVNLDIAVLWDNLWAAVRSLNWNEPITALQTLATPEWINDVLTQILTHVLGTDFETFKAQITQFVTAFCNEIVVNLLAFFVCWLLGFLAGLALTRFLIRRNIAKRSVWKFILAYFLNSLLSTIFVVATLIVFSLWAYSIIFTVILALLFSGIIALVQAYLLYAYKKLSFKQIVNFKNAGLLTLTNLIIFVLSICLTLVAIAINALMGLFVGLSLFAIALTVINLNAESFVIEQVQDLPLSPIVNKVANEMNVEPSKDVTVIDEVAIDEIK